ncbi:MAG: hypothetical protein C4527_07360 [Candidatus Omnitrophota bacterium]|nr:MAG: hypothetical protein C4527_07360 [Candidatus Omnitrophota bacterium]
MKSLEIRPVFAGKDEEPESCKKVTDEPPESISELIYYLAHYFQQKNYMMLLKEIAQSQLNLNKDKMNKLLNKAKADGWIKSLPFK